MKKRTNQRTAYGIYLPNDTEKWFSVTFTGKTRAHWYAEVSGLDPNDYEIRSTNETPAQNVEAA